MHRVDRIVTGHTLEIFIKESLDFEAKPIDVGTRMAQDASAVVRMKQSVEKMLEKLWELLNGLADYMLSPLVALGLTAAAEVVALIEAQTS